MNPMSHPQLGQSTHKEYENRYGSHYASNESRQETAGLFGSPLGRHKLALALSGLSVISVVVMALQLV